MEAWSQRRYDALGIPSMNLYGIVEGYDNE